MIHVLPQHQAVVRPHPGHRLQVAPPRARPAPAAAKFHPQHALRLAVHLQRLLASHLDLDRLDGIARRAERAVDLLVPRRPTYMYGSLASGNNASLSAAWLGIGTWGE